MIECRVHSMLQTLGVELLLRDSTNETIVLLLGLARKLRVTQAPKLVDDDLRTTNIDARRQPDGSSLSAHGNLHNATIQRTHKQNETSTHPKNHIEQQHNKDHEERHIIQEPARPARRSLARSCIFSQRAPAFYQRVVYEVQKTLRYALHAFSVLENEVPLIVAQVVWDEEESIRSKHVDLGAVVLRSLCYFSAVFVQLWCGICVLCGVCAILVRLVQE